MSQKEEFSFKKIKVPKDSVLKEINLSDDTGVLIFEKSKRKR